MANERTPFWPESDIALTNGTDNLLGSVEDTSGVQKKWNFNVRVEPAFAALDPSHTGPTSTILSMTFDTEHAAALPTITVNENIVGLPPVGQLILEEGVGGKEELVTYKSISGKVFTLYAPTTILHADDAVLAHVHIAGIHEDMFHSNGLSPLKIDGNALHKGPTNTLQKVNAKVRFTKAVALGGYKFCVSSEEDTATTPDVAGVNVLLYQNVSGGTLNITNFINGVPGQVLYFFGLGDAIQLRHDVHGAGEGLIRLAVNNHVAVDQDFGICLININGIWYERAKLAA